MEIPKNLSEFRTPHVHLPPAILQMEELPPAIFFMLKLPPGADREATSATVECLRDAVATEYRQLTGGELEADPDRVVHERGDDVVRLALVARQGGNREDVRRNLRLVADRIKATSHPNIDELKSMVW
jgi:hypothetical protein